MVITIPSGPLQTNCYLYSYDDEQLFIIDPADEAEEIGKRIMELNIRPAGIILTHTHFDHIMASGALIERFGKMPVYAHESEKDFMGENGKLYQRSHLQRLIPQLLAYAQEHLEKLPAVTTTLRGGDEIPGTNLKVIHTPGHTTGSICIYDNSTGVLFSGDTLFRDSVGRSDFEGGDHKMLIRSIKERLFTLPDETVVYPGHGESTTIGYERLNNPFV